RQAGFELLPSLSLPPKCAVIKGVSCHAQHLPPPPPSTTSRNRFAVEAPKGRTRSQLTTFFCKAYHGGHLTIRLALGGCTNRPFYRIVAAHNKCPRDGRFVEQLGSYDPLPNSHGEKLVALNLDRIRHWIGCGAQLSKPMEKLLGLSGFFPLHPMMITNAERLRRKRAREVFLASQKADSEPQETEAS
uniref:Small ribosomal subunit protein bS16m n=1 Tax=Rattus norvegicus TaxID=10116 RepID=D4A7X1_RAT